jgi:hypothetical protein
MRMLLQVIFPNEEFNEAVRDGTAGGKLQKIISEANPTAVYFVEDEGKRSVFLVLEVENSWEIPGLAEPWYLTFNAEARFRIAMTPDDLALAGLDELGGRWG